MSGTPSVDALLTARIGLDPEAVGSSLVTRGLAARMAALGLSDRDAYQRHLDRSTDELQALIEEVVVPESWFFRDDHPFSFLQVHVRSKWLIGPQGRALRALSLPCASGEEPYSIAMALLDAGLPPGRFRVDAVDVSARSLARARQAIYSKNAFRGSDLSFRDRYFSATGDRYQLDASVRNAVRLIEGNILDDGLLKDEPAYDVVFCRNLLIYFTDGARARASANLLRLLAPSGLLFLGHAERLDLAGMNLVSIGDRTAFAFARGARDSVAARQLPAPPPRSKALESPARRTPDRVAEGARPASSVPPKNPAAPPAERRLPGTKDTTPGRPSANPAPAADVSSLLDRAVELADQGRYDEAAALCEQSMNGAGHSARAYFLLGMIRQAAGDRDAAEAAFRKVVYLDAQHDEALLALALLAQRRGDAASASSYRRRAERALARKGVQ